MAILVYFTVIWYIFPVLVFCTKKNLATLGRYQPGLESIGFFSLFILGYPIPFHYPLKTEEKNCENSSDETKPIGSAIFLSRPLINFPRPKLWPAPSI
jgi:hypothetical protein